MHNLFHHRIYVTVLPQQIEQIYRYIWQQYVALILSASEQVTEYRNVIHQIARELNVTNFSSKPLEQALRLSVQTYRYMYNIYTCICASPFVTQSVYTHTHTRT